MQPLRVCLNPELERSPVNYFLSFLTDRLSGANKQWAEVLSRKFGGTFEPIFILSNEHQGELREQNYIVINESLPTLREQAGSEAVVNIIYPEDLSYQACHSQFMRDLVGKLIAKQGKLFVLAFSSLNLDFGRPEVTVLGPDPAIVEKYDNKAEQIRLFKELGILRHQVSLYKDLAELQRAQLAFPCYISASFSSGGFESIVANNASDVAAYAKTLRPLNVDKEFVVSEYIDYAMAPNISAIVCGMNDTRVICITDQLLEGTHYLGNIYPSKLLPELKKQIISLTCTAGDKLAAEGFRGIFGMDFLIDKNNTIYPIDLNPRRQGGYACNLLMSRNVSLAEAELNLVLGQPTGDFQTADIAPDFAWAHRKLVCRNRTIQSEYCSGSIESVFSDVGNCYFATYYPAGSLMVAGSPGAYAVSGLNREAVVARLNMDCAEFSKRVLGD